MTHGTGPREGRSILKVKGGKSIRVWCKYSDDRILEVRFSGDFFMHPEETVELLEERLRGADISTASNVIKEVLSSAELFGAEPEDFAEALRMAVSH